MSKLLPTPTADIVTELGRQYDADPFPDQALEKLFALYPKNTEPSEVLVKVAALNALYHAAILALETVAKHIVSLNIDAPLAAGDLSVVGKIARVKVGIKGREKERTNYSFATKYCWWHNHAAYPIWDSRVDKALWLYARQCPAFKTFRRQDLWDYPRFVGIVNAFQQHFDLKQFDYKAIDKFLYMLDTKEQGTS